MPSWDLHKAYYYNLNASWDMPPICLFITKELLCFVLRYGPAVREEYLSLRIMWKYECTVIFILIKSFLATHLDRVLYSLMSCKFLTAETRKLIQFKYFGRDKRLVLQTETLAQTTPRKRATYVLNLGECNVDQEAMPLRRQCATVQGRN
jgi:hypothetical protein